MKVALFTPYLPAPLNAGGRLRTYHLAKAVAKRAELHLFSQGRPDEVQAEVRQEGLSIYASVNVAMARWLVSPTLPKRVQRCGPTGLYRAFRRRDRPPRFDLVWVEHVHAARWAARARRPWMLDEHNIESAYLEAKWRAEGTWGDAQQRQVRRLERWERAQWSRASGLVAVTSHDAERMTDVRGQTPWVIPNGVDLEQVEFHSPDSRRGQDVLFVGLMSHPPNVEAGRQLAQDIMPRVWKHCPDARLVLCGASPVEAVRQLAGPRVEVTGSVPSVRPYLSKARVCAIPLTQGAGSSLKVVEALAAGVPLVATSVAVRGFPVETEQHFLQANDPDQMAAHIVTQLKGDPKAVARAVRGRRLAANYDWSVLADRFCEHLWSLVNAG